MSRLGDDEIILPMPGTARSSASADRSEMLTMSQIRFLHCPGFRDGWRSARAVRNHLASSPRSAPRDCNYSD
jgi:hypothetical protein